MVGARRPGGQARGSGGGETDGEYAYVEVMACPGGCTNGGGQVKVEDVGGLKGEGGGEVEERGVGVRGGGQKEWLARVDEAYFSMEESESAGEGEGEMEMKMEMDWGVGNGNGNGGGNEGGDEDEEVKDCGEGGRADVINGISTSYVKGVLDHWAELTGIELPKLVFTSYRKVESEVGTKDKVGDTERVVELAGRIGGGW